MQQALPLVSPWYDQSWHAASRLAMGPDAFFGALSSGKKLLPASACSQRIQVMIASEAVAVLPKLSPQGRNFRSKPTLVCIAGGLSALGGPCHRKPIKPAHEPRWCCD